MLELVLVFCALAVYALLPSKLKKIFWVNLAILLPAGIWIIHSQATAGYSLIQIGIRTDNWSANWLGILIFSLTLAFIMFIIGAIREKLKWNKNMTISLFLYPLWGCAQQFLILSYINIRLVGFGLPPMIIALITGLAFMSLHVPDKWLMPATLLLGFCFSLFFQQEPNLLLLGISHGWLGILYYYWVIGKDPIAEKFSKPKTLNTLPA
ncbi:MAG: hypothetical protein WCT08_03515 [Patescibacteria group bacterium]|jgi:hypothetical protein